MNCEADIDSILATDAGIVRFQRTRDSLLNIGHIPTEILGQIFLLVVIPESHDPDFARIRKGSYRFLLVCRRWYEAGRCTPELWTSWNNSLEDWERLHLRYGTLTLDLVL